MRASASPLRAGSAAAIIRHPASRPAELSSRLSALAVANASTWRSAVAASRTGAAARSVAFQASHTSSSSLMFLTCCSTSGTMSTSASLSCTHEGQPVRAVIGLLHSLTVQIPYVTTRCCCCLLSKVRCVVSPTRAQADAANAPHKPLFCQSRPYGDQHGSHQHGAGREDVGEGFCEQGTALVCCSGERGPEAIAELGKDEPALRRHEPRERPEGGLHLHLLVAAEQKVALFELAQRLVNLQAPMRTSGRCEPQT